jgi:hypothetical protein
MNMKYDVIEFNIHTWRNRKAFKKSFSRSYAYALVKAHNDEQRRTGNPGNGLWHVKKAKNG